MVRIGAASPELMKLIFEYFHELDTDKSGSLSLEELCKTVARTSSLTDAERLEAQLVKASMEEAGVDSEKDKEMQDEHQPTTSVTTGSGSGLAPDGIECGDIEFTSVHSEPIDHV